MKYFSSMKTWASAAALAALTAASVQAQTLVGHWKLDEATNPSGGTTAADAGTNGLNGIYSGVFGGPVVGEPAAAANLGTSANFDGFYDLVDLGSPAQLNSLVNDFTVMAWVNVDSVSTTWRFFGGGGAAAGRGGWGLGARYTGGGTLVFTTFGIKDYTTSVLFPRNQWVHYACVMDASNGVRFYLDGVEVAYVTGTTPASTGLGNWYIGATSGQASDIPMEYADGHIDDVRVYQGAMTATQVQAIYAEAGNRAPSVRVDENLVRLVSGDSVTRPIGVVTDSEDGGGAVSVSVASGELAPDLTVSLANDGAGAVTATVNTTANLAPGAYPITIRATDSGGLTCDSIMSVHIPMGAVGHWTLDETAGAVIDDSLDYMDGLYVGAPTLGQTDVANVALGTSVGFPGDASAAGFLPHNVAVYPQSAALEGSVFSQSMWVKGDPQGTYEAPVSMRNESGWTWYYQNGGIHFWLKRAGGGTGWATISAANQPSNEWAHLVATYNGSEMNMYLNGQRVNANPVVTTFERPRGVAAMFLGAGGNNGRAWYYAGGLDDVWYFDVPLNDEQVAFMYNNPGQIPDLSSVEISVTSPADGSSIPLGDQTTIEVYSAGIGLGVTQVEVFVNGASLGVDTEKPYEYSYYPSAAGAYTISAVATDNLGATWTSVPVTLNVTEPDYDVTGGGHNVDGVATASSIPAPPYDVAEGAPMGFDNNPATPWTANDQGSGLPPQWLAFELNTPASINAYSVRGRNSGRDPSEFQLQASNDGAAWDVLDSVTGNAQGADRRVFLLPAPTPAYKHYRIYITATVGATFCNLTEVEFLDLPSGDVVVEAPAEDTYVTTGTPVTLAASVVNFTGNVTAVDFFAGAEYVGEGTLTKAGTYTTSWTAGGPGYYAIRALVKTDDGVVMAGDSDVLVGVPMYVTTTGAGAGDGSSWANASTLWNAFAAKASAGGAPIMMKAGTYTMTADGPFIRADFGLIGGCDGTETLPSDRTGNYWETNLTVIDGVNTYWMLDVADCTLVLDSILFQNAYLAGGYAGAAIYQANGELRADHCAFLFNFDDGSVGGAVYTTGVTGYFQDCAFAGNGATSAGGAAYFNASNIAVRNCNFTNNYTTASQGGALYVNTCTTEFDNCLFQGNVGEQNAGAIRFFNVNVSRVTDCRFLNNTTPGTGSTGHAGAIRILNDQDIVLANCLFADNTGIGQGGAIQSTNSRVVFLNNTFSNNSTTGTSDGIYVAAGDSNRPTWMVNNIFSGHVENAIESDNATPVVDSNLFVAGGNAVVGPTATNSVTGDPAFVGTGDDPLDIQSASAAKNAGSNAAVVTDIGQVDPLTTDILGRPRDASIDIGAYEYQDTTSVGDWILFRD